MQGKSTGRWEEKKKRLENSKMQVCQSRVLRVYALHALNPSLPKSGEEGQTHRRRNRGFRKSNPHWFEGSREGKKKRGCKVSLGREGGGHGTHHTIRFLFSPETDHYTNITSPFSPYPSGKDRGGRFFWLHCVLWDREGKNKSRKLEARKTKDTCSYFPFPFLLLFACFSLCAAALHTRHGRQHRWGLRLG